MALYNRYLARVFNRVKSRVPPQAAEDVTQEAWCALYQNLNAEAVFNDATW
ncbi:MAG: hypothetical protein DPW16_09755 [Chloroflexi bacterium]|nr:hypothetical protein [Chloroflexota bacterium]